MYGLASSDPTFRADTCLRDTYVNIYVNIYKAEK